MAGRHSPFAQSLISFLVEEVEDAFEVSRLINKVCKDTANQSDQTPIGGVLDKSGDKGGQFVFRRKVIKHNNGFHDEYIKFSSDQSLVMTDTDQLTFEELRHILEKIILITCACI